jgi:hypothetical protein
VNFLLTDGHVDFFLTNGSVKHPESTMCMRLRRSLRLTHLLRRVESALSKRTFFDIRCSTVAPAVHRFEELIGGRSYLIEARPVDQNRWRAYIVRIPGVPTALMPFYGRTPAEAAKHLSDWLTRAHDRVSKPAGSGSA